MIEKPNYKELERYRDELKAKLAKRKSIEGDLKESQALYQSLFEHAGVAMVLIDLNTGKVVAFNKRAHEDLQYSTEEFKSLNYQDYIIPQSAQPENYRNDTVNNDLMVYESKLIRKDGTVMDALRSAVLVTIAGKKYIHNIRVDISEQKKTERLLRESEKRYRDILERMDEGYYEVDLAGNLTAINPAFSRIYGYPEDELIGMNNREYMTPETAKKVYRFFNSLYRTGKTPTPTLEYEVITKAGATVLAEISVSLIKKAQGEIVGFFGVVRDITERKNTQKALEEQEAFYRALFDHAGFAITLTDARTAKWAAYNKMAYESIGYTEEEYNTITARDYFVSTDEEFSHIVKSIIEKGSHTYHIKIRKKDGEIRDYIRSDARVKIGGKTYIHGIRVDVTEQRKTEEKLKESEARFRAIFEAAADAIFLIGIDNMKVLDANQVACSLLGYSWEELMRMSEQEFAQHDTQSHFTEIRTGLKDAKPQIFESVYVKKDGTTIDVEVSSCLTDHLGEPVVLSIVRDVTERKQAESELERYRKNLEEMVKDRTQELESAQKELLNQEKLAVLGQLTATVSHELRNPLGVIQSSNYYLQKKVENSDEKIQKHLKRIEEQVGICDTIVADLLEYTRGHKSELIKNDLYSWLPELLDQITKSERVPIHVALPKSLPQFIHDKFKLQRVVINLLDNAIQAVEERSEQSHSKNVAFLPKIDLSVREDNNSIIFNITDNGVGMDKITTDMAFEPLFTTRARGTGLGLANVKKIVSEHDGKIILNSEFGTGTTVSIVLPNKRKSD